MPSAPPPDRLGGVMALLLRLAPVVGVRVTEESLPHLLPEGVDVARARRILRETTLPPDDEPTEYIDRAALSVADPTEREQ